MKAVGLFEAKTKLSELCAQVAESGEPVVITRRGEPLVRIAPVEAEARMTVKERRARYVARHGKTEKPDKVDFEPAARSDEISNFDIEG